MKESTLIAMKRDIKNLMIAVTVLLERVKIVEEKLSKEKE